MLTTLCDLSHQNLVLQCQKLGKLLLLLALANLDIYLVRDHHPNKQNRSSHLAGEVKYLTFLNYLFNAHSNVLVVSLFFNFLKIGFHQLPNGPLVASPAFIAFSLLLTIPISEACISSLSFFILLFILVGTNLY